MIIGYSHWGFLGPGILDTPDGGRAHRRVLIDGLRARGHDIVFLQTNRDLDEAGHDLTDTYTWHAGLPGIDVLFLEWRWPIPGRNITPCGEPAHTCDLHRQQELLAAYADRDVPVLLWDKDRRLGAHDPLRGAANVAVCEPALQPSPGATTLLFPVADGALDQADAAALTARHRDLPLVYVGNQYDRDDAFTRYFAPAAHRYRHQIAGKWPATQQWPGLNFTGRIGFGDVEPLYHRSLATVLLLPDRYAKAGQMTQRLFEAVLAGCLPLTPASTHGAHRFAPDRLHITDGDHTSARVEDLLTLAGTPRHTELLRACLKRLDQFRLSRQLDTIEETLTGLALGQTG